MKHTLLILLAVLLFAWPGAALANGDEQQADKPGTYVLSPAYPNPFNPQTQVSLTVDRAQRVQVEVFNMLGQRVRLVYSGSMGSRETRTFTFDAGDLPTGIYLFRVNGETFNATRQVTLVR
jgi:hypothetical protein